jgi:hypothetical protein
MENIPTKRVQLTLYITSLPEDIIKYMAGFLNHDDARSLNQTCKSLRKHIPHKCLHPSTQVISHRDRERLKNKELILSKSEGLILDEMPLDSELINLIRDCCPKLKYLFIKYCRKCDVIMLNFENFPCVGIYININMLDMDCELSISNLSPAVESFTAHISGIDPKTFKIIPGVNQKTISLTIDDLKNLKSL